MTNRKTGEGLLRTRISSFCLKRGLSVALIPAFTVALLFVWRCFGSTAITTLFQTREEWPGYGPVQTSLKYVKRLWVKHQNTYFSLQKLRIRCQNGQWIPGFLGPTIHYNIVNDVNEFTSLEYRPRSHGLCIATIDCYHFKTWYTLLFFSNEWQINQWNLCVHLEKVTYNSFEFSF